MSRTFRTPHFVKGLSLDAECSSRPLHPNMYRNDVKKTSRKSFRARTKDLIRNEEYDALPLSYGEVGIDLKKQSPVFLCVRERYLSKEQLVVVHQLLRLKRNLNRKKGIKRKHRKSCFFFGACQFRNR